MLPPPRPQVARHALRSLRQQAREGVRLLEDKKVLEARVAELGATLETVQNQRNELRQQVWCAGCVWGAPARARPAVPPAQPHVAWPPKPHALQPLCASWLGGMLRAWVQLGAEDTP